MPEGNEVHRYARLQAEWLAGHRVRVASPNGRFREGAAQLDGRKLTRIDAYGKHLLYVFGRNRILHVHLGRYGKFRDGPLPFPEPIGALRLRLSTTQHWLELRGPTICQTIDDAARDTLLSRLGPDPLREDADPTPAFERIAASITPIGALLMDQSVIAGIGNIYRAELLFRARLSPFRRGRDVRKHVLTGIWTEAGTLLALGMEDRRIVTTRPAHRPHPHGKARRGEVHYVYRRDGLPCFVCGTEIQTKPFHGRDLFWCSNCQQY